MVKVSLKIQADDSLPRIINWKIHFRYIVVHILGSPLAPQKILFWVFGVSWFYRLGLKLCNREIQYYRWLGWWPRWSAVAVRSNERLFYRFSKTGTMRTWTLHTSTIKQKYRLFRLSVFINALVGTRGSRLVRLSSPVIHSCGMRNVAILFSSLFSYSGTEFQASHRKNNDGGGINSRLRKRTATIAD